MTVRRIEARFATTALALGVLGIVPVLAGAHGLDQTSEIAPFASEISQRYSLDESEVRAILSQAKVLDGVLEAISRPAEAKPWKDYRPIFLTEQRISEGVAYWHAHRETLDAATNRFGVSAQVIVAIIGVETLYGQRAGTTRVLDALATLGFRYPSRATFFRRELGQFLVLAREETLDPLVLPGSYAGAMGIGQFIPSSYREYAVDFDGDGRRDLISSHEDAIGSVANYLSRHGWRRDGDVAVPAAADGSGLKAVLAKGVKPHSSLGALRERGVVPRQAVTSTADAALIDLEGVDGRELWLVFDNFYAITRYNRSNLYAMAVHQLSLAIEHRFRDEGQ